MKIQIVISVLFGSMWHGYRRWMTLFNILSIVLSVLLATVITAFSVGAKRYIDDLVRREAAAGAVRANYGDVFVVEDKMNFEQADAALRSRFSPEQYQAFNLWWRSESHRLAAHHPFDSGAGGIYSSLGNTFVADPEGARAAEFRIAGSWISSNEAHEIVLTLDAARALLLNFPEMQSVDDIIGREIWIVLPPAFDHDPAASAQVKVVGIYNHLRDGACMTTPEVIQQMYSRIMANANGKWWETYDKMNYRVSSLQLKLDHETENPIELKDLPVPDETPIPLLCWRLRDVKESWFYLGGAIGDSLPGQIFEPGDEIIAHAQNLSVTFTPAHRSGSTPQAIAAPLILTLPPSTHSDLADLERRYPQGFILASPRLWNHAGYHAAPEVFPASWRPEAHYAYYYFNDLKTAREARLMLQRWGLVTYMPIDRFGGLISLVNVVTVVALALMITILTAATLAIVVTLYTEVDAGAAEIGLLKALGASNALIGMVFTLKGAFIGIIGSLLGIPAGIVLNRTLNRNLSATVADNVGLADTSVSLFYNSPLELTLIGIGIITLASIAAITPALLAARRDPQEALREE